MSSEKKLFIASDHAGLSLKSELIKGLPQWTWIDLGPLNSNSVDYPDYALMLAQRIASEEATRGVLICGSGIGMSISANKCPGIRAAVVENPVAARLSREHNDANVLCLGSRFIAPEYGIEIVKVWLTTEFSNTARHVKRLQKIQAIEHNMTKKADDLSVARKKDF